MRVGLQLPRFAFPGGSASIRPTLTAVAQSAEANGFASLWVMDHLFQLPEDTGLGGAGEPMLEAYTTLGFLAAATERIALGPMVASAVLRPPGLLVKAATALDVLAGGRTYFAVGAGWYEREARGLGTPWPSRRERFEHLEDTLRVATAMFADDASPLEGTHHRLAEPINHPSPIARPRIMVGGGGERKTLRLVAEYGDACNILVPDPGESRHKLEVLARHCEAIGRDVSDIETTSLIETDLRPGRQSSADVVAALRAQADEGIEHVIVNLPDVHVLERLDAFGREIIPAVA
ncbi:MAG TPA: TIGR03560 family F420-dependent LLM class oxidoreductase [Candidatus Saccharimonadales bacterium]|nr:TIGR03560 family F420-dependent LLM class oxidoreductase [Candidatus Saccharimonadales bacterium]